MKFIGTLFLLVPFLSFAGGSDGGGGNGVVCYDQKDPKKILSVDLLDFYEGRILEGYQIPERQGSFKEIYNEVVGKSATEEIKEFLKSYVNLERGFKYLPEGVRLKPINDSSEIFIPDNCKVEQIINFQGASRIFVVGDFWKLLTDTQKAGLLLHEVIWLTERTGGVKNSSRARRTVARYFADNYSFHKIETSSSQNDYLCRTAGAFDVPGPLGFYGATSFYVKKNDDNSCELRFLSLNRSLVYSSEVAELESCDEFLNLNTETGGFNIFQEISVFSQSDYSITYQVTLGRSVEVSGNTRKLSRSVEVKSLEFPNYSDPMTQLYCDPVHQP